MPGVHGVLSEGQVVSAFSSPVVLSTEQEAILTAIQTNVTKTKVTDHGSNLDVDTAAEVMTSTSFACINGVTVKADITNLGTVFVGLTGVTPGNAGATDGFPLYAGDSVTIEATNTNLIYVIASVVNQKVYWIAS